MQSVNGLDDDGDDDEDYDMADDSSHLTLLNFFFKMFEKRHAGSLFKCARNGLRDDHEQNNNNNTCNFICIPTKQHFFLCPYF